MTLYSLMVKLLKKIFPLYLLFAVWLSGCYFSAGRSEEFEVFDPELYQKVTLNYTLSGAGDTTLIFLHDWNLDHKYWDYQVKRLEDNYRILNIDLAGHGESGRNRKRWNLESLAMDVENVIRKESVSTIILVGHGLGAHVALRLVPLVPDRITGIIGVEAFQNLSYDAEPDSLDKFVDHLSVFKRSYPEVANETARTKIRSRDREVINRVVGDYKRADPKISLSIYKSLYSAVAQDRKLLYSLPFQLRLISNNETALDEKVLNNTLRFGWNVERVYGTGHFPMVEQPDLLLVALRNQLRQPVK